MNLLTAILNFNRRNSLSDELIVGNHNIDAYNYVKEYPNWANKIIYISGPEGSGKKYVAEYWKKLSEASKINLYSLTEKKLNTILESNDCFVLENIEIYFSRKFILRNLDNHDFECLEKTVFTILDHVINEDKYLLISSSKAPNELNIQLADLKSRLISTPVIRTNVPDEQTLKTFLIREFASRQLKVTSDICDYILKRYVRSFDELEELVSKIDNFSIHQKRNITKPFIKEVIDNELING